MTQPERLVPSVVAVSAAGAQENVKQEERKMAVVDTFEQDKLLSMPTFL